MVSQSSGLGTEGLALPAMDKEHISSLLTHEYASRIAEAARAMGYKVERRAASARSRSAYVICDRIKVRVADHPSLRLVDIDVHTDTQRLGSVSWRKAIRLLDMNRKTENKFKNLVWR